MFNVDGYGVYLTNEGSNGDSAHHSVYAMFMKSVLDPANIPAGYAMMEKFAKDGGYARHPTRETNDFTRDQFTPFLAYSSIFGIDTKVMNYYKDVMRNDGIFFNDHDSSGYEKEWWNRDWMDPATRGIYLRGLHQKSWKLYLTDLHLLSSVVFRVIKVQNTPSKTADENLQLHLLVAKLKHSTFISDYAAKFYFKNRPDNDGGIGWRGAILDFWSRNGTYLPDMVPLAIGALEQAFGF